MSPPVQSAADLRWTTSAVLVALATRKIYKGCKFTSSNMKEWVPGLREGNKRKHASETLLRLGFITQKMHLDEKGNTCAEYTVTVEGEAAIKAVADGKTVTSGPKGPHHADRKPGANTFAVRLWALMRARGMLDSDTAASTLVDAADQAKLKTAAKTAQRYMARWASTGAITESRAREANGCKRYVLTKDTGPIPPAWTPKAKARQRAQTTE